MDNKDKAKEVTKAKNPFKIKNKFDKEMVVISTIIDKAEKSLDVIELIDNGLRKLLNNTKDPIQCWIRANVLDELGRTNYALLFKAKAYDLGYAVLNTNESISDVRVFSKEELEDAFNAGTESALMYDEEIGYDKLPTFEDYFKKYNTPDDATNVNPDIASLNKIVDKNITETPVPNIMRKAYENKLGLEAEIAENLLPKIQAEKAEKGSYTVKDLEQEILTNGGDLAMSDNVMAALVNLGFDFDSELETEETEIEQTETTNENPEDVYYNRIMAKYSLSEVLEDQLNRVLDDLNSKRITLDEASHAIAAIVGDKGINVYDVLMDIVQEGLRNVTVEYDNGETINTDMAAHLTDDEIKDYYAVGKEFNLGSDTDRMAKVKAVTINEFRQQMEYTDTLKGWNIYPQDMEEIEKPEFNDTALKNLISSDIMLKFAYETLNTYNEADDLKNIYKLYVKNDVDMTRRLKTFESYTLKITEDANNNEYVSILNNKLISLEIPEDEKMSLNFATIQIGDKITQLIKSEKDAFSLNTQEYVQKHKDVLSNISLDTIISQFKDNGFSIDDLKDKEVLTVKLKNFIDDQDIIDSIILIMQELNTIFYQFTYLDKNILTVLFVTSVALILKGSLDLNLN